RSAGVARNRLMSVVPPVPMLLLRLAGRMDSLRSVPAQLGIAHRLVRREHLGLLDVCLQVNAAQPRLQLAGADERRGQLLRCRGPAREEGLQVPLRLHQRPAERDRLALHRLEQRARPLPLFLAEGKRVPQLEHMGRARIPVELGRLGEPHALAAKQRFDLLRRQRLDGAALLPRIGRSLRHLGRCPGRCRRGRRGQYRPEAKGPYVSHGSISSSEPRSPERPLPRPAKSSAPRPDPCPLGGSPPCAGPASGAPWAGLPAAGRSANRRRPMHPPVKRGWFTAPLSLSAITALSIGIACATATAQEIKLPSTLTVSAYDTGSSGFNMAVAIGKMLKDKHGVDLRVLPGGNDIARLAPVKSGRAAA